MAGTAPGAGALRGTSSAAEPMATPPPAMEACAAALPSLLGMRLGAGAWPPLEARFRPCCCTALPATAACAAAAGRAAVCGGTAAPAGAAAEAALAVHVGAPEAMRGRTLVGTCCLEGAVRSA